MNRLAPFSQDSYTVPAIMAQEDIMVYQEKPGTFFRFSNNNNNNDNDNDCSTDSALVPVGLQLRRKLRRKHAFKSLNPACPLRKSPPLRSVSRSVSTRCESRQSDWNIWDGIYELYCNDDGRIR